MGKPSTATHKTVWMFRSDDENLTKLKRLLVVRNVTTTAGATTPNALGIAIRLAVKQLEQEAQVAEAKEEAKAEIERQARQIMAGWTEAQWDDFRRRMRGEGSSVPVSLKQLGQDSDGFPRQDEPTDNVTFGPLFPSRDDLQPAPPRSWESGWVSPAGTTHIRPLTEPEDTP